MTALPAAKGRFRLRGWTRSFWSRQVIQDVDRRRTKAEGEERDDRRRQQRQLEKAMRRQERQEDEQVLDPLVQPQRLQPHAQAGRRRSGTRARPWRPSGATRRTAALAATGTACGAPAARPDVVMRIAGVVEAAARRSAAPAPPPCACDDRLVTPSLAMTSSNRPRCSATFCTNLVSDAEHSTMWRPRACSARIQASSSRDTAAWRCRARRGRRSGASDAPCRARARTAAAHAATAVADQAQRRFMQEVASAGACRRGR